MNFDPEELLTGLMVFVSTPVPGVLLTYLLMREADPAVLGDHYAILAGTQVWAAFLFESYLFGHLVFLLGSWLDEFYNCALHYTLKPQTAPLRAVVAAFGAARREAAT